jgi:hypothetical protein
VSGDDPFCHGLTKRGRRECSVPKNYYNHFMTIRILKSPQFSWNRGEVSQEFGTMLFEDKDIKVSSSGVEER